ncbi:MAG: NAD(P)/FAD-dependent oxidoreductase [Candidatus Vecturithrix sp.]|jgi:flavin-dependent dehydrogenase|nr:NAD(P)/FAD-dependent oxidoreductase [Candidatus Vecturithrix sp.]
MIHSNIIIIGGGPAGSTCAWKLRQQGVECIILDKQAFPRPKLCAGWITPEVLSDLQMTADEYPHSLRHLRQLQVYLGRRTCRIKAHQYAIRRVEFDHWLLQRSDATVYRHEVKQIRKERDLYVLDDRYTCKFLVGAGGTSCPVYRTLFRPLYPRAATRLVVTLEQEFPYAYQDDDCHLWFFQHRLPGYAWYVPKEDGYLNIGIGGFVESLKARQASIRLHWQWFAQELKQRSLIKDYPFEPRGYAYYTRSRDEHVQQDNAFLIGDAAGLATKDLAEGIGPAVRSGLLAADAIISGQPLSLTSIRKYSQLHWRTLLKFVFSKG